MLHTTTVQVVECSKTSESAGKTNHADADSATNRVTTEYLIQTNNVVEEKETSVPGSDPAHEFTRRPCPLRMRIHYTDTLYPQRAPQAALIKTIQEKYEFRSASDVRSRNFQNIFF